MADDSSRSPFKLRKNGEPISNDTLFVTTIGTGLAVISAVAIAGWSVRGVVEEYKNELASVKRAQVAEAAVSWNVIDMNYFSYDLKNRNPSLQVVDPYSVRKR